MFIKIYRLSFLAKIGFVFLISMMENVGISIKILLIQMAPSIGTIVCDTVNQRKTEEVGEMRYQEGSSIRQINFQRRFYYFIVVQIITTFLNERYIKNQSIVNTYYDIAGFFHPRLWFSQEPVRVKCLGLSSLTVPSNISLTVIMLRQGCIFSIQK